MARTDTFPASVPRAVATDVSGARKKDTSHLIVRKEVVVVAVVVVAEAGAVAAVVVVVAAAVVAAEGEASVAIPRRRTSESLSTIKCKRI